MSKDIDNESLIKLTGITAQDLDDMERNTGRDDKLAAAAVGGTLGAAIGFGTHHALKNVVKEGSKLGFVKHAGKTTLIGAAIGAGGWILSDILTGTNDTRDLVEAGRAMQARNDPYFTQGPGLGKNWQEKVKQQDIAQDKQTSIS